MKKRRKYKNKKRMRKHLKQTKNAKRGKKTKHKNDEKYTSIWQRRKRADKEGENKRRK